MTSRTTPPAHTPTPWQTWHLIASGGWRIQGETPVAEMFEANGKADAAFIVRACNSHDGLLGVCRRLRDDPDMDEATATKLLTEAIAQAEA